MGFMAGPTSPDPIGDEQMEPTMSTVFKAMGELSVAAHRADVAEPRMVLEFATYDALVRFERQMLQDTHEVAFQLSPAPGKAFARPIKYAGVELVLSVRS